MNRIYFDQLQGALHTQVFSKVQFRPRSWPSSLYHYTTENGFRGIVACQRFRATTASRSTDRKEIAYGCQLLSELIDTKAIPSRLSAFTVRVLNELKSLPGEGIERIFLASFCEKDDCLTLWKGYGGYSLRFATGPEHSLFLSAPSSLAAGQGFVTEVLPAIYDRSEQAAALSLMLDLLIETLENRSLIAGFEAGPAAKEAANFVAFTISSVALRFIVNLKDPAFEDEREWRIVATPSHLSFSSDRAEADRNCECHIKADWSKPYINLACTEPEVRLMPNVIFGLPTPPLGLPIAAVRVGPCIRSNDMVELATETFERYGPAGATILRSEIPVLLDLH